MLGALIGAAAGAVIGAANYLSDVYIFHNEALSGRGFAGAVLGGAAGGAVAGVCDAATLFVAAVACNAGAGFVGEGVNQLVTGDFDGYNLFTATALRTLGTFAPKPFKLVGRRPTNLSNLWQPSGPNNWRMYGNAFSGAWQGFVQVR